MKPWHYSFREFGILGIFDIEGRGEPLGHPIVMPFDLREDVATSHLELRDTPILAKDVADITWEIRRERLTKAELMNRGQHAASMRSRASPSDDQHLASAFIGSFKYIDAIDRRIAQLEVRRGNILAEIERRNDRIAQRLAAAVDVEDAEYSELAE